MTPMLKGHHKNTLKVALKLGLGAVLIYYVLHSKMVDFNSLHFMLSRPTYWLIAFIMLGISALSCAIRWHIIVRAQGLSLSLKDLFELTMIGNFFNTFMPGSVGGDLIKAWYVAGHEHQRKTKAVFTVLLDRVIGLAVILFYAAFTLFIHSDWVSERKELQGIAYFLWAFTSASLVIGVIFFLSTKWKAPKNLKWWEFIKSKRPIGNIIDSLLLYRNHFSQVSMALILSGVSISGVVWLYAYQGQAIGINMDLAHYFFIVPIGLTVSAVPLLPGGIGVGQVAFFTLFQWANVPNPELGSTLCTLMQVYTILFNCLGAIFYVKYKKKPKEAGLESFTMATTQG
jgi:uncharacterized protein (TIRG00374 family)